MIGQFDPDGESGGALESRRSILFVQARYHPNQHPIVRTLLDHGHTVNFLSLRYEENEEYSLLEPDLVHYSPLFRWAYQTLFQPEESAPMHHTSDKFLHRYGLPSIRWYVGYLRELQPDLLIVKGYHLISYLTILIANPLGIDLVFYDQDPTYSAVDSSRSRTIARRLHSGLFGKPFVRVSPVLGDDDEPKMTPDSYYLPFVAEPGPDAANRSYVEDGVVRLIMIGKFTSRRKNHIPLLRIVRNLANDHAVHLTMIGSLDVPDSEHYGEIRRFVDENGMSDIVDIQTNRSYEEVQAAYSDHDVYVLPSRNERAAVSPLEAMAHGLPVICGRTNGTSCYVEPGGNGYLFEPGDWTDLENKIELLLSKERIEAFGARSTDLVQTEYDGERFYERFDAILSRHFERE